MPIPAHEGKSFAYEDQSLTYERQSFAYERQSEPMNTNLLLIVGASKSYALRTTTCELKIRLQQILRIKIIDVFYGIVGIFGNEDEFEVGFVHRFFFYQNIFYPGYHPLPVFLADQDDGELADFFCLD
jgi:hypothetical protein